METLARAAQSNSSLQQLIQSGILKQFSQAIEGIAVQRFYLFSLTFFTFIIDLSIKWN